MPLQLTDLHTVYYFVMIVIYIYVWKKKTTQSSSSDIAFRFNAMWLCPIISRKFGKPVFLLLKPFYCKYHLPQQ